MSAAQPNLKKRKKSRGTNRGSNGRTMNNDDDNLASAVGPSRPGGGNTPPPKPPPAAAFAKNSGYEVRKFCCRALDKGVGGLREEFAELRRFCPTDMSVASFKANHEAGRNRYPDVPCQDKHRIILRWPNQQHDYIHANYVSTPVSNKRFICTQGPMDNTINDFWHMVIQEECESVIMLCNCIEKNTPKCSQYWPTDEEGSTPRVYGDVEVSISVPALPLTPDDTSVRKIVLLVKWQENGKMMTREVRHFQWVDWPDRGVPPCKLTIMSLLSHVRGSKKPITVHCSAGIGRTGTIVAIEFIIERLMTGNPIETSDEILRQLRGYRPYSIQTDLQYLFIHRIMLFHFIEKNKLPMEDEAMQKYRKFVEEYNLATKV